MAALHLSKLDQWSVRVAYVWLSLPGTLVAALTIGQFVYAACVSPKLTLNPFALSLVAMSAILNPGWIIFPTVLIKNATAESSSPVDGFFFMMCCLLTALWLWGFWIDNSVMPRIIDAFA
jgi:hypothetical protein